MAQDQKQPKVVPFPDGNVQVWREDGTKGDNCFLHIFNYDEEQILSIEMSSSALETLAKGILSGYAMGSITKGPWAKPLQLVSGDEAGPDPQEKRPPALEEEHLLRALRFCRLYGLKSTGQSYPDEVELEAWIRNVIYNSKIAEGSEDEIFLKLLNGERLPTDTGTSKWVTIPDGRGCWAHDCSFHEGETPAIQLYIFADETGLDYYGESNEYPIEICFPCIHRMSQMRPPKKEITG